MRRSDAPDGRAAFRSEHRAHRDLRVAFEERSSRERLVGARRVAELGEVLRLERVLHLVSEDRALEAPVVLRVNRDVGDEDGVVVEAVETRDLLLEHRAHVGHVLALRRLRHEVEAEEERRVWRDAVVAAGVIAAVRAEVTLHEGIALQVGDGDRALRRKHSRGGHLANDRLDVFVGEGVRLRGRGRGRGGLRVLRVVVTAAARGRQEPDGEELAHVRTRREGSIAARSARGRRRPHERRAWCRWSR